VRRMLVGGERDGEVVSKGETFECQSRSELLSRSMLSVCAVLGQTGSRPLSGEAGVLFAAPCLAG
jgi:hypothetical protein